MLKFFIILFSGFLFLPTEKTDFVRENIYLSNQEKVDFKKCSIKSDKKFTYEGVDILLEYVDGLLVACTYSFSDGSCSYTRATCSEARSAFEDCACAAGHDRFCPQSGLGGDPDCAC